MAQVKKYKKGDHVNRDLALDVMLELAKANASEDQLRDYNEIESVYNAYTQADPLHKGNAKGLDRRKKEAQLAVLTGQYKGNKSITVDPTKNIFGGYASWDLDEISEGLNRIAMPKYYGNTSSVSTSSAPAQTTSTISSTPTQFYIWNPLRGYSKAWITPNSSEQERAKYWAKTLYDNLTDFANNSAGKSLQGIRESDRAEAEQLRSLLGSMLNSGQDIDIDQLMNISKNANVFRNQDTIAAAFRDLFSERFREPTEAEKKRKNMENDGYSFLTTSGNTDLDKIILQRNLYLALKNGTNYLFDSEMNPFTESLARISSDWRNLDAYGRGFITNNGQVYIGDLLNTDENNPYYEAIQKYISKDNPNGVYGKNNARFTIGDKWNNLTSQSESDIINRYRRELHGKNIINVGAAFGGDGEVIATSSVDPNTLVDRLGHLRYDSPNLTYYYKVGDTYKKGSYSDVIRDLGDLTLNSDERDSGIASFQNFQLGLDGMDSTISMLDNFDGRNWWQHITEGTLMPERLKDFSGRYVAGEYPDIKADPVNWAKFILYYLGNQNKLTAAESGMLHRFYDANNPENLAAFLWQIIKMNPEILNDENNYRTWMTLLRRVDERLKGKQAISQNKEGGILKAATGTSIGFGGLLNVVPTEILQQRTADDKLLDPADALQARAAQNGKTPAKQVASEQGWTNSDSLRAFALSQDILATIAAVSGAATGGFGFGAAGALGISSMATDLVADIFDPSVSAGEAAKNAAVNTGLAALGMIPGGGSAKILKSALKLIPRAVGYAAAANIAINPEVHESISTLMNQDTPGAKKMTTKDWQNIGHLLRAVSGVSRGVSMKVGSVRANKKLNVVKSQVDENKVYLEGVNKPLEKSVAETVRTKLKAGNIEEAKKVLTDAGLSESEVNSALRDSRIPFSNKKVLNETKGAPETDNLKLAQILEAEDTRAKLLYKNNRWQRFLAQTDDLVGGGAYTTAQRVALSNYGMGPRFSDYRLSRGLTRTGVENTRNLQNELVKDLPGFELEMPTNTQELRSRVSDKTKVRNAREKYNKAKEDQATSEEAFNKALESSENQRNVVSNADNELNTRQSELTDKNKSLSELRKLVADAQKALNARVKAGAKRPNTTKEGKALKQAQEQLKQVNDRISQLLTEINEHKVNRVLAQRELSRLQAEADRALNAADVAEQLTTNAKSALRSVVNKNLKLAEELGGNTYRTLTVGDVTIPRKTQVAYLNALNPTLALKALPRNSKILDVAKLKALAKNGEFNDINGAAYNEKTGKLYIWLQGGTLERFQNYKINRQ